jgi:hypothetical protein
MPENMPWWSWGLICVSIYTVLYILMTWYFNRRRD